MVVEYISFVMFGWPPFLTGPLPCRPLLVCPIIYHQNNYARESRSFVRLPSAFMLTCLPFSSSRTLKTIFVICHHYQYLSLPSFTPLFIIECSFAWPIGRSRALCQLRWRRSSPFRGVSFRVVSKLNHTYLFVLSCLISYPIATKPYTVISISIFIH